MSLAERERQYSPSSCIGGNYQPFIRAYRELSLSARVDTQAQGARWQTLRYGAAPAQTLELCLPPNAASRPANGWGLLVFIHGGYWQELSARDSLFAATACVQAGLAFAALDYTLSPRAHIEEIVLECRDAVDLLFKQAPALGIDVTRVVISGSSAGAHLAAMLALPGVLAPSHRLRAVALVSGIYELEPLLGTSINDALSLNADRARSLSPSLVSPIKLAGFPTAVICWGEIETAEFKRQSQHFAELLWRAGSSCEVFEIAGRNHFDVIIELADADSALGAVCLGFAGSEASPS